MNLDGTGLEEFPADGTAKGLALDFANSKVYWSNDAVLYRANLADFSAQEMIYTAMPGQNMGEPCHRTFAFDPGGNKLYWNEREFIKRSDPDGSNVETIYEGPTFEGWWPCTIALDLRPTIPAVNGMGPLAFLALVIGMVVAARHRREGS